jgi:hypothetical protein
LGIEELPPWRFSNDGHRLVTVTKDTVVALFTDETKLECDFHTRCHRRRLAIHDLSHETCTLRCFYDGDGIRSLHDEVLRCNVNDRGGYDFSLS